MLLCRLVACRALFSREYCHLISPSLQDSRTELNYTSPLKYAKPPYHTTHHTHNSQLTTHNSQLTTHNSHNTAALPILPKVASTPPLVSLQHDEYVYPRTTNKFFPNILMLIPAYNLSRCNLFCCNLLLAMVNGPFAGGSRYRQGCHSVSESRLFSSVQEDLCCLQVLMLQSLKEMF